LQQTEQSRGFAPGCFRKQRQAVSLKAYRLVFIRNRLKVHRLVQGLLSDEKWQSDCEMLQCAADDYASAMHEADR